MPRTPVVNQIANVLSMASGRGVKAARRRGNMARDARMWSEAAAAYNEYLSYRPKDGPIWVQLGHMLKESGRLSEARTAYEHAVSIDPTSADAQLYFGRLLKQIGNIRDAACAFEASFKIDGNVDARRELANPEIAESFAHPRLVDSARQPSSSARRRNVGTVDYVNGVDVLGWAINPDNPSVAAEIEFRVGERVVGGAVTNRFRADVALLGLGNVESGFEAALDLDKRDKSIVRVGAFLKATGEELDGSPFETTGFSPLRAHSQGESVTTARFAVAKRFSQASKETALFVSHSPDGVLKPHVLPYLRALQDNGIDTLLIVVAERPTRLSSAQLDAVSGAIVRENIGYDFAAWSHAIHLHPEVYSSDILYLINDSMFGPNSPDVFRDMIDRIRKAPAEMVGLTDNHESGWHIQSFFLAMKAPVLRCLALQNFFSSMVNLPGKQAVIDTYEIKLAPLVEANGFKTDILFSAGDPRNATMFAWRELIESGFPFVKTLLFRQSSHLFDITGWDEFLLEYGFDVKLLKDTLKHQGVCGPVEQGFPLLAMPADNRLADGEKLKVAFYGPWNYDNGLGSASRGIIAAIRSMGALLNLHPVKKTFHIHRPLVPDYDVLDFVGPADIAVIHLNPDSWHLLTDQQRYQIRTARKRIGYWVWEMSHIPEGWAAEFSSVDRIWAPSGYCAELFDAQNAAPVDVVPHAVAVSETNLASAMRDAFLDTLGLPAGRRVILYVFDGSSYLVRKNPHALTRAFAASGLGERGWTLVLKTKHLMDRPQDGKVFEALALDTPNVLLINRSLPQSGLDELMAAADIYASSHCSEGFGLTIAEAMAAGKSVVATDFGGSTEFLDESCGYPVAAQPYRLSEDFGHYSKGGEWALIEEPALAVALQQAAEAIERGDYSIGDAARRRVRERLSFEAIGERVKASFAAVLTDPMPRWEVAPRLDSKLLAGKAPDNFDTGPNITVMSLRDGSLEPERTDELARVPNEFDRWLMLLPGDAKVNPDFRSIFMPYAASRPDVAIFYCDDVALAEEGLAGQVRLKPDFDITLFIAQDYIGAPLIVRGSALHALGGLRHSLGAASLTDLVLRAWAAGMSIARLPYVMTAQSGKRPTVPVEERRALFTGHPALAAYSIWPGLTPETLQLARSFGDECPPVTLVIPTRRSSLPDGRQYIERLLDSVESTDWPMGKLHVLVGDDMPGDPEWATKGRPYAIRRVETPRAADEPFNYAAKMNVLWRATDTDHIVLLNDDVDARDPAWLKALMTFAMSEDVGAVGPFLSYEDGSIQHAGVVGGLFGLCAHPWLYRRTAAGTYQNWALTHREWSMITGAVVATRRSMMERVNGFDERFALEFNDLDLCLRMRISGARIVYTPHARMTHAEKASRGPIAPPAEDLALFRRRWEGWLASDPAFHPRLRRDRFDIEPSYEADDWFVR